MNSVQHICKIISNENKCPQFFRLQLEANDLVKKARPGQFVHIRVSDGLEPFFRRPFSVFRSKKYLEIFYDVLGKGTEILSRKMPGDELDILGPLGNSFSLPPQGTKNVVMIAGGIGVAPFMMLSDALKRKKYKLILLYGARNQAHVFSLKEYKDNGCAVHVSTDDGSVGTKGRVSELFSKIPLDAQKTFIYTCGPNPMMAAVQQFAKKHGLAGQASCEAVMACGLGACLGCVIKTTSGYKTVCHDGPVFDLQEVVF